MSMTKRYKEQDDILGLGPSDDEWVESAENEPTQDCIECGCPFSAVFEGVICPDCVLPEANEREWAQALADETEDEQC